MLLLFTCFPILPFSVPYHILSCHVISNAAIYPVHSRSNDWLDSSFELHKLPPCTDLYTSAASYFLSPLFTNSRRLNVSLARLSEPEMLLQRLQTEISWWNGHQMTWSCGRERAFATYHDVTLFFPTCDYANGPRMVENYWQSGERGLMGSVFCGFRFPALRRVVAGSGLVLVWTPARDSSFSCLHLSHEEEKLK